MQTSVGFCIFVSMCKNLGILFEFLKNLFLFLWLSFFVQLHVAVLKPTNPGFLTWFLCLPFPFAFLWCLFSHFLSLSSLCFFSLALQYWKTLLNNSRTNIGDRAQASDQIVRWSEVKVPQSCLTLYTVHGILQARILEWVAFPFFRGSSQLRDWTQVSRIAGGFFTSWATRKAQEYWSG